MEKKSGLLESLTIATGTHLLQNKGLDFLLKTRRFSKIIANRLNNPDGYTRNLIKGTANTFIPELRIAENEARHFYKNIVKNMGYKEKVFTINFLKGRWSDMANKPSQRRVLKRVTSKIFPHLGAVIDKLPPETIEALEKTYKKDVLGDNIARLTKLVQDKIPKTPQPKYQKFLNRVEALEEGALAKLEPSIPLINGTKYFLAANLKKLKDTKLGRTRLGGKAIDSLKKIQDKSNEWFVKKPIEDTAYISLSGNKLERLRNNIAIQTAIHTQNALIGRFENLERKLLEQIRKRHPKLARETGIFLKRKAELKKTMKGPFNIRGLADGKNKL